MRPIVIILGLLLLVVSCGKDDDCPNLCISNIEEDIVLDIHYNRIIGCLICTNNICEKKFNSEQEFTDFQCYPAGIPIELGFEGIILLQSVKVPYVGPNGGDPGYSLDVSIQKDTCVRQIDFKFILTTIDTSRVLEHNENVIILLNGIDSTYTVNFSHEIIPYKE
jgi:hypothetical protein